MAQEFRLELKRIVLETIMLPITSFLYLKMVAEEGIEPPMSGYEPLALIRLATLPSKNWLRVAESHGTLMVMSHP